MCLSDPFGTPSTRDSGDTRSVDERADRHVRRLIGFYAHLASFVGVNTMLVAINLLTSPGVFWALWPLLGWGVAVAGHAAAVFGRPSIADWKARVRRRYIRRQANRPAAARGEGMDAPSDDTAQLHRRIEHLEAIVTSVDWDLLVDRADTDSTAPPKENVAALREEVVSG